MQISIVLTIYKTWDELNLILLALNQQKNLDFELIIAEDDKAKETKNIIKNFKAKAKFSIQHISQADTGWNKCAILNKALKKCNTPFVVFLDGDCIPQRHFTLEYIKRSKLGNAYFGRRLMLSKLMSESLKSKQTLSLLNTFNFIITGCKRIEEGIYIPFLKDKLANKPSVWGCNWGAPLDNLLGVNGFDTDYNQYGFEDADIEWRLKKQGVKFYTIKHKAIVYHLHHPVSTTEISLTERKKILNKKMGEGKVKCERGIESLECRE